MSASLIDKVVLITGASSGFGADAARLFAREGCFVVLAARRVDRLTALVEAIQSSGGHALAIALDVTGQGQIDEMVQAVLKQRGRIDILFNNAGVGRLDWLETLDPESEIDPQIDVNLRGAILVARAVLPSMLAHRSGHIINVSSVAGLIAAPMYSIYAATKYGLRGFTDALRREVTPFGIKISGFYPGPAVTEFGQHSGSDRAVKEKIKVPGWLYMTSEYVARQVVRLAKHPRRMLIIPWYYRVVIGFDRLFPGLVDWFLKLVFVRKFHKIRNSE